MRTTISAGLLASTLATSPLLTPVALAHDPTEIRTLKKQIQELQRTVEQLQQQVESLGRPQPARAQNPTETALDQAVQAASGAEEKPLVSAREPSLRPAGSTNQRLLDLSFVPTFLAGSSTANEDSLQTLQGGGHDPHKRGFTMAEGEIGLGGVVDPYFRAQAYLSTFIDAQSGATGVELEEAYLTTQQLPFGLENPYRFQLEVGHFFTRFGRLNPQHPHQWEWIDQPVIHSRLFGGDGMRAPGFRASIGVPSPWTPEFHSSTFHFGMQNANGATMTSFLGGRQAPESQSAEEIGKRPKIKRNTKALKDFVYLARWENYWNFSNGLDTNIGVSGLYGPNATGPRGDTWIYGLDMKWKWRPVNNFRGWPFLTWQAEIMQRDFRADRLFQLDEQHPEEDVNLPGRTLHDWGLYSQLLYGFSYGWAAGLRYEYASGSGASVKGREHDPFRANRQRVSPLLSWQPSEFTRIRLQYNYDRADHLTTGKNVHSVWLGFQWLYGVHPPHEY
ncbi:MAG: hypothetical protein HY267_06640 [Deltaproteobacteria bacterium]|nr:hypothetical protein [Deltaproteobacteria bacterium]